MASRRWNGTMSDMICPVCRNKMLIPRNKGKQREKGHRKNMWCYICHEERNFVEIREKDFVLENVIV